MLFPFATVLGLLKAFRTAFMGLFAGLLILVAAPSAHAASSFCTAMLGIVGDTTPTNYWLGYWNSTAKTWNTSTFNLSLGTQATEAPNALAGSFSDGKLYYVERLTGKMKSIDLTTFPLSTSWVGSTTITATGDANATVAKIFGGATDASGNYFVYATTAANPSSVTYVAQLSTSNASLVTPWTLMLDQNGRTPNLNSSGDLFVDAQGQPWFVTNTTWVAGTPTLGNSYARFNLTPGASFGQVQSPSTFISNQTLDMGVGGMAVDPQSGLIYLTNNQTTPNAVTYILNIAAGTITAQDTSPPYRITDLGNCSSPAPDAPTITKSFSNTTGSAAFSTTTLTININNPNKASIYLTSPLIDVLPSGMKVTSTAATSVGSCGTVLLSTGRFNTVTSTVGAGSVSLALGSRIPGTIQNGVTAPSGCTISVVVTVGTAATPTGVFQNTIPAGSLTTTAGNNAVAAVATYILNTADFSITKFQQVGTTGGLTQAGISVGTGNTLQYVLTVSNISSISGTVTFQDVMPIQITPVLTVAATTPTGLAGVCTTTVSVAANVSTVKGTYSAAVGGAQCVVTVTAKASSTLAVTTNVSNTATIAAVAPSVDKGANNNTSTVVTTIVPGVNLTIAKTNNLSSATAGSTFSYTVTVANTTAAAGSTVTNAMVTDPVATGLNCTAVTCGTTGGAAVCPAASAVSIANLQGPGIAVTLPPSSTINFNVTCGVTATGQ
jgi:uncharacterized repeat protein (TIGR01451 family)